MGAVTTWERAHYEWILHSYPFQQGELDPYRASMPPDPSLPPEPQWFPTALSPAQQDSAPYAFQHSFLKNETTSSFSEENIC